MAFQVAIYLNIWLECDNGNIHPSADMIFPLRLHPSCHVLYPVPHSCLPYDPKFLRRQIFADYTHLLSSGKCTIGVFNEYSSPQKFIAKTFVQTLSAKSLCLENLVL